LKTITWTLILLCAVAIVGFLAVYWYGDSPGSAAGRALADGNVEAAIEAAERRLATHPGDTSTMLVLARSYGRAGRWVEAEAYFCQVPLNQLEDLHLRARGLVARGLWCESSFVFEQILQKNPADGQALEQLARIRIRQERNDEALELGQQLTQIPSWEVHGYLIVGAIEYHKGSYARAAEALEEVVRRSNDVTSLPVEPASFLEMLADALLILGRAEEAEQHARRARDLAQSPNSSWLVGVARHHQGDSDGARQYWQETVDLDPMALRAIRELGRDALLRQQPEEALRWLERARAIDPNDKGTLQAMVATYRRLGRETEAREVTEILRNLQQ
jgi:tetratricopeptide (TPR) repeat protein